MVQCYRTQGTYLQLRRRVLRNCAKLEADNIPICAVHVNKITIARLAKRRVER